MGSGKGNGLPDFPLGAKSGANTATLTVSNLPSHNHLMHCNNAPATVASPSSAFMAQNSDGSGNFAAASDGTTLNVQSVSNTGSGQPFSIMQPYLGLYIIIALQGIFPSRN